jgi:hypothetical protein
MWKDEPYQEWSGDNISAIDCGVLAIFFFVVRLTLTYPYIDC